MAAPAAGAWGDEPRVSPSGKTVAFISDRTSNWEYDVHLTNRDGAGTRPLGITNISKYNQSPIFLPDGTAVLFLAGTEENTHSAEKSSASGKLMWMGRTLDASPTADCSLIHCTGNRSRNRALPVIESWLEGLPHADL